MLKATPYPVDECKSCQIQYCIRVKPKSNSCRLKSSLPFWANNCTFCGQRRARQLSEFTCFVKVGNFNGGRAFNEELPLSPAFGAEKSQLLFNKRRFPVEQKYNPTQPEHNANQHAEIVLLESIRPEIRGGAIREGYLSFVTDKACTERTARSGLLRFHFS